MSAERIRQQRLIHSLEDGRVFSWMIGVVNIHHLKVRKNRYLVVEDSLRAHLKDLILIALNTAMRKGEILGMKKSWVNLRDGIINVPRYAQKRKTKDKRVPINSVIKPILRRRLRANRDSEYVFVNPRTGKRYIKIHKSWSKMVEKAGIHGKPWVDKLRFHDLRHTAASNLARAGKDIKFIAQYLGHSDVKTSARYIHYSDEDLKDGAEILAQVPTEFTTPKVVSA